MNKLFSIILIILFAFGCSESFLDKQPEDTLAPGIFFQNPEEIKNGVAGIYQQLQPLFEYDEVPHVLGMMSDDGTRAFSTSDYHEFNKNNSHSRSGFWNGFYKMVVNANNVIDIIDNQYEVKNDAERTEINALRGEACFLRALAYFYLVRFYGDVPVVTERLNNPGDVFGIGRTPVNTVYTNVIIPDLEFAVANCYLKGDAAIANEEARATKGAALTILGKVYLRMENYEMAAATLKKLIVDNEAGTYALLPDYSNIWLPSNKFNSESVFEVNYNVGAGYPSYYFRNITYTSGVYLHDLTTTNGMYTVEKDLMDAFVAAGEEIRFEASVDSSYTPQNGLIQPVPLKLMPSLTEDLKKYDNVGTDYNYMITRYADALLMYAEALMMLNQTEPAVSYVNQVRARAEMDPIDASELDVNRILHERRMELAFEGHRYFDLVRTGKAVEVISAQLMSTNDYEGRKWRSTPIPEYQLLLPIPVGEIEKDQTLTQNPGY